MGMLASYTGPLIDAHHHLWSLGRGAYPWLESAPAAVTALGDLASIRTDYLPDDHEHDLQAVQLVGSVHIEALHRDPDEEVSWLDALQPQAIPERYVAAARLEAANFAKQLPRLCAHPRIAGVRSVLSWHPDAEKSFIADKCKAERPAWRRGVEQLCRAGLILELMVYPFQAEQVERVARDFPGLTIIINHCGSPIDQDSDGLSLWREALDCLAGAPNIYLKASNPGAYVAGDSQAIIWTIRQCLSAFGYARTMFGSDLPVAKLNVDPASIVRSADLATAAASAEHREAFFYGNASKVYHIEGGL